jgi:hypothetical protein
MASTACSYDTFDNARLIVFLLWTRLGRHRLEPGAFTVFATLCPGDLSYSYTCRRVSQIRVAERYQAVHASRDVSLVNTTSAKFDLDAVFTAHYSAVTRAIARVIGDPGRAEELAVDVFWRLCKTSGAQGESAPGWLRRTAVRLATGSSW